MTFLSFMEIRKKKDVEDIVDEAMHKVLGVSIDELNKDISVKLSRSALLDFTIDTKLGFKKAKKRFKQDFLKKLLRITYGNISEVALKAGIDRRSIHRIVKDAGINVSKIRDEMIKPYEIKQKAVGNIIEEVVDTYKNIIHPGKIQSVYRQMNTVTKDILDELPEKPIRLKEAEEMFEREFIKKAIKENQGSITATAKKIGLRYETLLRKMKKLGLK